MLVEQVYCLGKIMKTSCALWGPISSLAGVLDLWLGVCRRETYAQHENPVLSVYTHVPSEKNF